MSQFQIRHITRYLYENMVRDSANQIMLYPLRDEYQEVLHHQVTITGNPMVNIHQDYFGNEVGTFTNAQPHCELVIDSQLKVVTSVRAMPVDNAPAADQWKELTQFHRNPTFIDFLRQERFEVLPEVTHVLETKNLHDTTPLQAAIHLCLYVYENFAYRKGITTVETTVDEIWKLKSGVCQDFAHILLVMLRILSIPARYVSGYICPNKSGMRGEGATHAWVEAYIPFYGWLGVDPTNNCLVNDTHVRLAVGKNFLDCSPVKGTYRGTSNHTLEVIVTVSYEDGHTYTGDEFANTPVSAPAKSVYNNSFRKFQEMQMQQ
jgi:transglutaminase-like putative cysteine protease